MLRRIRLLRAILWPTTATTLAPITAGGRLRTARTTANRNYRSLGPSRSNGLLLTASGGGHSTASNTRVSTAVTTRSGAPALTTQMATAGYSRDARRPNTHTKEEEELYQTLIESFRSRLKAQPHKPENYYQPIINQLVQVSLSSSSSTASTSTTFPSHSSSSSTTSSHTNHLQLTRLKDRLALAVKYHDFAALQKEQDQLEMQSNTSTECHLAMIRAWVHFKNMPKALTSFEIMEDLGVIPRLRVLTIMIRALTRNGDLGVANEMMKRVEDLGLRPSTTSIYDWSAQLEYWIKVATFRQKSLGLERLNEGDLASLLEAEETAHATTQISTDALTVMTVAAASATAGRSAAKVHETWNTILDSIQKRKKGMTINSSNRNSDSLEQAHFMFSYRTYLSYLVLKAKDTATAAALIDSLSRPAASATSTSKTEGVTSSLSRTSAVPNMVFTPQLENYPKLANLILNRLLQDGYRDQVQVLLLQNQAQLGKIVIDTMWSDLMAGFMAHGQSQKARWVYNDLIQAGLVPNEQARKMYSSLQVQGQSSDGGSGLLASKLFSMNLSPHHAV